MGLLLVLLLVVVGLFAAGRMTLLQAGLLGLVLAVPAVGQLQSSGLPFTAFLTRETLAGAWVAWPAIAVIFAGLMFHTVVKRAQPQLFVGTGAGEGAGEQAGLSHRRLFALCFLVGPFVESVTGFGVGAIVSGAAILRMGLAGPSAVILALFSQMLVPWGALSLGTTVGASLIHVPAEALGVRTAVLFGPLVLAYLGMFWCVCRREGLAMDRRQMGDDLVWVGLLVLGLYAANRFMPVETAGILVAGLLTVLRYWRDESPSWLALRHTIRGAAPFLLLTLCLMLTRGIPAFAQGLQSCLVVRLGADFAAFPVLFHVSGWLFLVACVYGFGTGQGPEWRGILRDTWRAGRMPGAVTLVFVILARWMSSAGISMAIAEQWSALTGVAALLATPVFGAVPGLLTGSCVTSNSMVLPLQVALAGKVGADPLWVAALQNSSGSAFTMFSPIRIGMVSAVVGLVGQERQLYRRVGPLVAVVSGVLLLAAVGITLL